MDANEQERLSRRYPSHAALEARTPATSSQAPAADAEAARLAAKYPSHSKLPGARPAAATSSRATADSEEARLAARYPSHAKLRELAPPDRDPALERRYPTHRELRAKESGAASASDSADDKPAGAGTFELPEGVDASLFDANDEAVREFVALAEALDPKRRGELLGLHARVIAQQQSEADAEFDRWETVLRSDPEIGGASLDETARLAQGVVNEFGTRELSQVVDAMNLGSHPEFVRLLVRVGRELKKARGGR